MKKKLLFRSSFLFLILFHAISLIAQTKSIQGKVTNVAGSPLAGVTIRADATNTATQTNEDGTYTIQVGNDVDAILFSILGYQTKRVDIGESRSIDVQLLPDEGNLDEVVVTGYSTQTRRSLTGAVSSVTAKEIENRPVLSFDQALTGKAAGVMVNTSSGLVGDNVLIRIRGASSISSGSQPLIVLDGIPLTQGNQGQLYNPSNPLADINPNDIASFEILKDASATAIYGSRGAAGVILITTKKGRAGFSSAEINSYIGFNEASRKLSVLTGEQYNDVMNRFGIVTDYGDIDGDGIVDVTNTDWQEELMRTGFVQNHQLSLSGGNDKTTYYTSVNYGDNNSYIQVNRQRRWTARANVDSKITNWFQVGVNMQYGQTNSYGLGSGTGGALSGFPFGALTAPPNIPVYDPNGNYYIGSGGNTVSTNVPNPYAVQMLNYDNLNSTRFLGSAYAQFNLAKGLSLKSQLNLDFMDNQTNGYWNNEIGDGVGLNELYQTTLTNYDTWDWFNTLNYNNNWGNHSLDLMVGLEYTRRKSDGVYWSGFDIIDPALLLINASNFNFTDISEYAPEIDDGLSSYFGSANYSYKQRYFLNVNFRADGYSGFGANNRFGYFPSAGAGWLISEEDFMKDVSYIKNLKLRASYGYTGNSNIGYYPAIATFSNEQYADLVGAVLTNPGNPDLVWEVSRQFDIGVDLSIGKGIDFTLDYYDKKIEDMILNNPVLATLGFPDNTITSNIGSMVNRGVEFTLSAPVIKKKDFSWDINFNLSYNYNKVLSTNDTGDFIYGGQSIAAPGEALGSFYLIEWAGVNPDNGNPQFYDANGNIKQLDMQTNSWVDGSGAATTPITANDRVIQEESPYPQFFGGFSNSFRYKQFDFSFDLQYSFGAYMFNTTQQTLMNYANTRNKSAEILNAWTTPGQETDVPVIDGSYGYNGWSTLASTRFLESSSFVRLRNIQLGYNMPKNVTESIGIKNVRFYGMIQNLFLITGYSGIDPEANSNGNTNIGLGIDNMRPYLPRTYTFGVNIGF